LSEAAREPPATEHAPKGALLYVEVKMKILCRFFGHKWVAVIEEIDDKPAHTHDYCERCRQVTYELTLAGQKALWRDAYKEHPTDWNPLYGPGRNNPDSQE
jgi:hypothetical protein